MQGESGFRVCQCVAAFARAEVSQGPNVAEDLHCKSWAYSLRK